MKVLVVTNLYPPHFLGGYEILCDQVVEELRRRRHDVKVLTSTHRGDGKRAPAHEPHVARILELYVPFPQEAGRQRLHRWIAYRRNYRRARDLIQRLKPDVVFVWSQLRLTVAASRAAHDEGVPVVYTFNDEHIAGYAPVSLSASPRRILSWLVDKALMPSITLRGLDFSHSTAISRHLRDTLVSRGVDLGRTHVIYQGIIPDQFPFKEQAGAISRPVRVLYVGQLHPYKGAHTLLEAADILGNSRGRDYVRVTIIGDGPVDYMKELRRQARDCAARVCLPGKVEHSGLPEVYREHDIFVFPSIWREPFGLTHLEAMASGIPVVSTVEGGHRELLRHGKNALIFPPGDAHALAACIEQLIDDHDLRERLVFSARKQVIERFNLRRYVAQLEHLLLEARLA